MHTINNAQSVAHCSTLKTEAACFSKPSVNSHSTTRRHIPEDSISSFFKFKKLLLKTKCLFKYPKCAVLWKWRQTSMNFGVLLTVLIKIVGIMPCTLVCRYRHYGGSYQTTRKYPIELNWMVFAFEPLQARWTYALRQALCAPYSELGYRSPVALPKFQMAPVPSSLISSGSRKKDPSCVYLSEAYASHLHKMWADVFSSVPHFLQTGLPPNPITYRCLLRVLCPVSRSIITLDWVLLKQYRRALAARSGPEINSRACLCVLQVQCHNARCWFTIQHFIFLLIICLETPRKCSGPTKRWTAPLLASLSAISFRLTPACPGTQYSPTAYRVEISFNACWRCRTRGDVVLTAWRAFRAARLSDYSSSFIQVP
jgi:hypothetical protein